MYNDVTDPACFLCAPAEGFDLELVMSVIGQQKV